MFDVSVPSVLSDAWLILDGLEGIATVLLTIGAAGLVLRSLFKALGFQREKAAEDEK